MIFAGWVEREHSATRNVDGQAAVSHQRDSALDGVAGYSVELGKVAVVQLGIRWVVTRSDARLQVVGDLRTCHLLDGHGRTPGLVWEQSDHDLPPSASTQLTRCPECTYPTDVPPAWSLGRHHPAAAGHCSRRPAQLDTGPADRGAPERRAGPPPYDAWPLRHPTRPSGVAAAGPLTPPEGSWLSS